MSKTIRIDDDIYESLKQIADPFEDTPNTVIRKLLISYQSTTNQDIKIAQKEQEPIRIKKGTSTTQLVYESWLLYILWKEFKGRARKTDITKAVISNMQKSGLLNEVDFEKVSTGETRAENKIAWGRNRLKDEGLISPNSPAGIWELTEQGVQEAKKVAPQNDKSNDISKNIKPSPVPIQSPHGVLFEYRVHNAKAMMIITESNLYSILKGSTAVEEEKSSIPENVKRKKKELIQSGVLVVNARGLLEFTETVEFKSSSSAASLISGSSTDGLICFKDKNGKTLKQYLG